MKSKLTLLALACGLSFAANAQVAEEETLKSIAGNKTLEAGFNLSGDYFGQIKLRSFTTDDLAFRYTFGAAYDYQKLTSDASSNLLTLDFAPGVEKHYAGTKRLSPYLGFAVPISARRGSYKDDSNGMEIKGASSAVYGNYNRSYIGVGVQGLAGADLYVAKNFYVGIEAGLGVSYTKYSDVEVKYRTDFPRNSFSPGYDGFSFNTFTKGGLRVGFAF